MHAHPEGPGTPGRSHDRSPPGSTPGCVAICSRDPGNELVSAECLQLTGGTPDGSGVALCETLDWIPRAAYVQYGARGIVETGTLDALIEWLNEVRFQAADFRLRLLDLSDDGLPSKRLVIIAVADAIHSHPNLDHPQHELLLTVRDRAVWLGEIVVEAAHDHRRHEAKPYHTAGSLPAQLARALVNLVGPGVKSIVNPCCGTGSILLEACALGLEAHGADWSPRMAGMSRRNLARFDYVAPVDLVDAREWTRTADAVIADLPYGRDRRALDEAVVLEILKNAASLAPLAVFVAGADISSWLERAGFRNVEVFRVRKTKGFSRYIHRALSLSARSQ